MTTFIRHIETGSSLDLVAGNIDRYGAQWRSLGEGLDDWRAQLGCQRIFEVLTYQRTATIIDAAHGVFATRCTQMRRHRGIESSRIKSKIGALGSQRRLYFGSQLDAVGRIAIFVQQLQGQQTVDDLVILDIGNASQLQRGDGASTRCTTERQTAHTETDRFASVAGELAFGRGAGFSTDTGDIVQIFHRPVEEDAGSLGFSWCCRVATAATCQYGKHRKRYHGKFFHAFLASIEKKQSLAKEHDKAMTVSEAVRRPKAKNPHLRH